MDIPWQIAVWLLGQAAAVTWVVNKLKAFAVIGNNPHGPTIAAGVINIIGILIADYVLRTVPTSVAAAFAQFVAAVIAGLASTGVYEATKPAA